jgi:hypothetical protein
MLAASRSFGGINIRGTTAAVDPGQGPKLSDIAAGDRNGDGLQIGGALDPDRAAAASTAGRRGHCGGDPLDGGLEQQREGAALLGDRDGAAGAPDLLDRERGHPGAILRQVADSHSAGATEGQGKGTEPPPSPTGPDPRVRTVIRPRGAVQLDVVGGAAQGGSVTRE